MQALARLRDLPDLLHAAGFRVREAIGFEADVLPYRHYNQLLSVFPDGRLVDCSLALRQVRQVKTPFEQGEIRAAGSVWARMMEKTRYSIHSGADDHVLSVEIDTYGRTLGGQGSVRTRAFNVEYFAPEVLVGAPGAVPSHFDGPTGMPNQNACFGCVDSALHEGCPDEAR